VSSGWIKNIREYIHDGQKLVCFVHGVDKEKGTIDISLKRGVYQGLEGQNTILQPREKAHALFSQTIKKEKETKTKEELEGIITQEFGTYTKMMENAVANTPEFVQSKLPKKSRTLSLRCWSSAKSRSAISCPTLRQSQPTTPNRAPRSCAT